MKRGLWFTVYLEEGKIYVDKDTENNPSIRISRRWHISKNDFLLVYSYYDKWLSGDVGMRHEVIRKSRNAAYIFALIDKFN